MRTFSLRAISGSCLEGREQLPGQVLALVPDRHVPGLVVDARADDVDVVLLEAEGLRDQLVPTDHPVAQAHHLHAAVLRARPRVHGHGVGVVQEQAIGRRHLGDVLAEVQQHGHGPLAVHDAPGSQGVAHALVDAVLQRHVDVRDEPLQAADAHEAEHVVRALERGAPVLRGREPRRELRRGDVALQQPVHHVEVARVDVGEADVRVAELGHAQDVADHVPGEADAAGSDDGDGDAHQVLLGANFIETSRGRAMPAAASMAFRNPAYTGQATWGTWGERAA